MSRHFFNYYNFVACKNILGSTKRRGKDKDNIKLKKTKDINFYTWIKLFFSRNGQIVIS